MQRMRLTFARALAAAVLVFLVLFLLRLGYGLVAPVGAPSTYPQTSADFELARKNYATDGQAKLAPGSAQPLGDAQKYEQVASVGATTSDYDADRQRVDAAIAAHGGIVQYERANGLPGRRVLNLGIGVPPDKFDNFIAETRKIGTLASFSVVRNDKTTEYKELRAKRETLDKARAAIESLRGSGGSVDERLKVQASLTDMEQKIQDIDILLGDFAAQNELDTVKLSLNEVGAARGVSWPRRLFVALEWTIEYYLALAAGLLLLATAFWLGALAASLIQRTMRNPPQA